MSVQLSIFTIYELIMSGDVTWNMIFKIITCYTYASYINTPIVKILRPSIIFFAGWRTDVTIIFCCRLRSIVPRTAKLTASTSLPLSSVSFSKIKCPPCFPLPTLFLETKPKLQLTLKPTISTLPTFQKLQSRSRCYQRKMEAKVDLLWLLKVSGARFEKYCLGTIQYRDKNLTI